MGEAPQGLRDQFQNLCELKTDLGNLMLRESDDIEKNGLAPTAHLVTTLETFHDKYTHLESALSLTPLKNKPVRLDRLEKELEKENVRDEAIVKLDEIGLLSHIDDSGFAPLAECKTAATKLKRQITKCKNPADDPDTQKLISGQHGLSALFILAQEGDQLADDRWTTLHDQLTDALPAILSDAALGRKLMTAVSRGKIEVAGSTKKEIKTAPVVSKPEVSKPEVSKPVVSNSDSALEEPVLAPKNVSTTPAPEKTSTSIFDSDTNLAQPEHLEPLADSARNASRNIERVAHHDIPESALPIQGINASSVSTPSAVVGVGASDFAELSHRFRSPLTLGANIDGTPATLNTWGANQQRMGTPSVAEIASIPIAIETPVDEIAKAAYHSNGEHRDRCISHLIWRMLTSGRSEIAYHLSQCLEQRVEISTPFVSSRLIRAVTLGQQIRHPVGEAANLLTSDFTSFGSELTDDEMSEWNIGIHFLLQAAALRPALIAPGSGATHVLRNVKMLSGGSEMHNYRVRVALFGDQAQPLDPHVFKRATSEVDWADETEQLHLDIESWQSQAEEQTIRYTPATQIFLHSHWSLTPSKTTQLGAQIEDWKIWNQVILTVNQVLRPVLDNNIEQIRWVRERVDLLASMVPVDEESDNDASAAALPDKEMRIHVREGVSFARRWLALHDARPGQSDWVIPKPALDLSEEIARRHEAVLEELSTFEMVNPSFIASSAMTCYRNAMEELRHLFDPAVPFSSEVLNPRHLLHAELLKNPTLSMNENWEPNGSILSLEADLLELIMNGHFSWQDAFESRSSYRDHQATERMLELDVWTSETERHQFHQKRENRIAQCRTMLQRDIVETRARVQNAAALGLLAPLDQEQFKTQLDRLEVESKKTISFAECYTQLRDVCDRMERRRQAEIDQIRYRFEQLQLPEDNIEFRQIATALETGNIAAASQFIETIETSRKNTDADWVR